MKITIEIVGLCGAGKTKFIELIKHKIIKENNDIIIQTPEKNTGLQYFKCLAKILSKSLFNNFFKMVFFLCRKNNWWLINKLAYREASLKKKKGLISILNDTGVMQPFISFEIERKKNNINVPLYTLLNAISLPNIVVFFDVNVETARKRYEKRGLRGEGNLLRKNSKYYFEKANETKEMMIEYCKQHNIRMLNINSEDNFNDEYIDSIIKNIINEIMHKINI